jgi:hypothetical protein
MDKATRERIEREVADWPPLSDAQRTLVAVLMSETAPMAEAA